MPELWPLCILPAAPGLLFGLGRPQFDSECSCLAVGPERMCQAVPGTDFAVAGL